MRLGYRLRKASWGRGFATEGVRALIRRAFSEMGVRRVVAHTYETNVASRRVMEKAGMSFVRAYRMTPDELAAATTFDGSLQDVWEGDDVEYAIEKHEFDRSA
jgi:RimJ/RimL family protein N-acetyltransferase